MVQCEGVSNKQQREDEMTIKIDGPRTEHVDGMRKGDRHLEIFDALKLDKGVHGTCYKWCVSIEEGKLGTLIDMVEEAEMGTLLRVCQSLKAPTQGDLIDDIMEHITESTTDSVWGWTHLMRGEDVDGNILNHRPGFRSLLGAALLYAVENCYGHKFQPFIETAMVIAVTPELKLACLSIPGDKTSVVVHLIKDDKWIGGQVCKTFKAATQYTKGARMAFDHMPDGSRYVLLREDDPAHVDVLCSVVRSDALLDAIEERGKAHVTRLDHERLAKLKKMADVTADMKGVG